MKAPAFKNKHLNQSPKLGWKPTPPERLAKIPKFATYCKKMAAGVLPAEFDYSDKALASFLQMLGNNAAGDCTIAALLKQIGLVSANRPSPKELVSSDSEALKQYPQICGPGDEGCYIPDALDWWRDKGVTCGGVTTKILGYVRVDTGNELEIAKALYLSGSLHAGLLITQRQYEEAAPDAVWEPDTSPIVGGHSIPLAGRKPKGWRFGTWAMKCFITQGALANPRAEAELYAVVDAQWFDQSGLNNFGVDVTRLKNDLAIIAAGGDVPIPDPSPLPPPPPPTPGAGTLTAQGTLDFLGTRFPIDLAGQWAGPAARESIAPGGTLAVLMDLAQIAVAFRAKDWPGVALAVEQLLADLGLTMLPHEVDAFTRSLLAAIESRCLCHSSPAN